MRDLLPAIIILIIFITLLNSKWRHTILSIWLWYKTFRGKL